MEQNKRLACFWLSRLMVAGLCLAIPSVSVFAQSSKPGNNVKTTRKESKEKHLSKVEEIQQEARVFLIDRKFKKAIALLEKEPLVRKNDSLLFLLARAQALDNQHVAAAKSYLLLAELFPASFLRDKALLSAASSYQKARNYKKAQKINGEILRKLLSNKRRLEIANIYLRYGKRYAKTKGSKRISHARKAASFFQKALALGLPPKQKREITLLLAKTWMAINSTYYARRLLRKAVKEFPKGPLADQLAYWLAISLTSYKSQARRVLQDFLVNFPKSKLRPKVLMALSATYGVPRRTSTSLRNLGIGVLQRLIREFPSHKLAKRAQFYIAKTWYSSSRHGKAIKAFHAYLKKYGKVGKEDKSRYAARARYSIARSLQLQSKYLESIAAYQKFLQAHSTDRLWPSAQRQIVSARMQLASHAYRLRQWKKAKAYYQDFLKRYPLNGNNALVMYNLGQIEYRQKRYKMAITAWKKLVSKYPSHYYGRRAQWEIARIYETKLSDYETAIKLYKKITNYSYRYRARRAIKRLSKIALSALTPRVFTTGGKAYIEVTTRNLKELKLRLYRVDAETYFRKMNRFSGMTRLDTELIRPDKKWSFKIPKYRRYHLFKNRIPLSQKKPMVAVVEITGGKLVAKTIAIVSNLQIITKAGARSLFVFALDGKKRIPLQGVKLLISNGSKVVLEGKTNKEGVFRNNQLKNCKKLHVLALKGGSVASNHSSLYGISYTSGIRAAGLLYTDRAAYRPGETANIKGLIREVKDGSYQIPNKPYLLEIRDPHSRVLVHRLLKPSEFGSIHTSFVLGKNYPQGVYRITATRKNGVYLTGTFRLAQFRLPRYRLSMRLPKRVYFRHQTLKGRVQVKYGFGGPVKNKRVLVQLMQGWRSKKSKYFTTDKKGQVTFSWPLHELNSDATYTLRAMLVGTSLRTEKKLWLRSTAFDLSLSTIRSVMAAGENFDVTVKAMDPSGKLYAPKVALNVLRRVYKNGQWVETSVQKHSLQLAKNGKTTKSLILKKGGRYILRVSAVDAWKRKVASHRTIYISGEGDKTVLRLLSNRQSVWVGERETVKLLSQKSGPALVTYEGETVLKHFFFPTLSRGTTLLPIQFTRRLSPNFALRVTMLGPKALHTAQKYFVVSRRLKVTIRPKKSVLRPGAWAEVEVFTRDQTGKPVAAELSLAVVNQSLLSLYPDKTPTLSSVFFGQRRKLQIKTLSSHTWRFVAYGKKVASILLQLAAQKAKEERARRLYRRSRRARRYRRRFLRRFATKRRYRNGNRGILGLLGSKADKSNDDAKMAPPPPPAAKPRTITASAPVTGTSRFLRALRKKFKSTAFWKPTLLTNKKGYAVVRFRLPDDITQWKLFARGVAKVTLVGEGFSSFRTAKALLSELRLPSVVTEGDRFAPTSMIHNTTGRTQKIKATLNLRELGVTQTRILTVKARSSVSVEWSPVLVKGNIRSLTAQQKVVATTGKQTLQDAVERKVQVRYAGVEVVDSRAGTLRTQTAFQLQLPLLAKYKHLRLQLQLHAMQPKWLLSVIRQGLTAGGSGSTTLAYKLSLVMSGLRLLKKLGLNSSPEAKALQSQLNQLSRALWAVQSYYGGWSYDFNYYRSVAHYTVLPLSVLAEAATEWGAYSPSGGLKKARRWLRRQFYRMDNEEEKVRILYALVHSSTQYDRVLFAYSHRLYRKRRSLSLASLALLSGALQDLSRQDLAKNLSALLASRLEREMKTRIPLIRRSSSSLSKIALVGLGLSSLVTLAPNSPVVKKAKEWLLKQQSGQSWGSIVSTTYAAGALAVLQAKQDKASTNLKVQVFLNKSLWKTVTILETAPSLRLSTADVDASKPVRLSLRAEGQGQLLFSARLSGYTLKPAVSYKDRFQKLNRHYLPKKRRLFGRTISYGKSLIKDRGVTFKREVKRVRRGEEIQVHVRIYRRARKSRETLRLREVIPAGLMLVPGSVSMSGGQLEIRRGSILATLNRTSSVWYLSYRLIGAFKGVYTVPGTRVWSYAVPSRFSLGKSTTLRVVSATAKPEVYPLSPNEMFYMGRLYFQKGKFKKAGELLAQFVKRFKPHRWALKQATQYLLKIALKQKNFAAIVANFERLKELTPSAYLPLHQVALVGKAYALQNEFERANMVYLAAMDSRFVEEMKVAATLEKEGEFKDAMNYIERLVYQYPDIREVQNTFYAMAQSAVQQASKKDLDPEKKVLWRRKAWTWIHNFQWTYPLHPSVDAASYTQANLLLEMGEKKSVVSYLKHAATLYPNSRYLASMHYLQAYALYLLRRDKEALKLLKSVSSRLYPDGRGSRVRSKDRYLATYLMAQIHHARQELGQALVYYKKIQSRFPDAKSQVKFLARTILKVPEVTTFSAQEKVAVQIRHQNIHKFTILVYRVDLMKLYLLKKNLNAVTRINLAGIRPTYKTVYKVEKPALFASTTLRLALPLTKRGSYLVVLKSKTREVSGIVLKTDLNLRVQEETYTGRVTSILTLRKTNAPVSQATIRVVGSRDGKFRSGRTDLRGTFAVTSVRGKATIIAQKGDDFAFFRGKANLRTKVRRVYRRYRGYGRYRRRYAPKPSQQKSPNLLDNVWKQNNDMQRQGRGQLLRLYKLKRKGVQMRYLK